MPYARKIDLHGVVWSMWMPGIVLRLVLNESRLQSFGSLMAGGNSRWFELMNAISMANEFVKFNIVDIITIIRSPKHRRWGIRIIPIHNIYIYLSMPTLLVINANRAGILYEYKNTKFKWSQTNGESNERMLYIHIFIHVFTLLSCHCGRIVCVYCLRMYFVCCRLSTHST